MELYRVIEVWQLALVYEVRKNTAISMNISLPREYDEEYGKNFNYVLLADNKKGYGTLRINFENDEFAKIERVAVIKTEQHSGLGRKIMTEAEDWIKEEGYNKIVIHSLNEVVGFYEKLGYKRDDSIELDYGPDGKRQILLYKFL